MRPVPKPEPQTHSASEADEFNAQLIFMFTIPAALLVFFGACAAIIAWTP